MEKDNRNVVQIFLDNLHSDAFEVSKYIANHPKKMMQISGLIIGLGLTSKCSYNAGQGAELNKIMNLQNAETITHPYHGYDPKVNISSQNAEQYLLDMKKGEQFKYDGQIITLMKRIGDKEPTNTGFTDYVMVGNQIRLIHTSNLNSKTIDQVFGK